MNDGIVLMGKWIVMIISLTGYSYILRKKSKAEVYFIPISVLSAISLCVYFGGMINLLFPISCAVLIGGILCFIRFLMDLIKHRVKPFGLSLFGICFTICAAVFIAFLFQASFQHYDNYSHWALIIKQLLCTNAFPDASSKMIEFSNYPLGTASLIYYVCRFTSHSEGIMLAAQGSLIFACFLAMFGVIKEKKRFLLYSFLGAGCSRLIVFNISIRINNLLVDFVLPMMTLAALSISYRYQENDKLQFILLIPILGLLTIVKSTGVIFSSIAVLYVISLALKKKTVSWKRKAVRILQLLFAYLPIVLWQIRQKTVFSGVSNKFDVSASAAKSGLAGKTAEDIQKIVRLFLSNMLNVGNRSVLGFLLFQCTAMIAIFFAYHFMHKKWRLKKRLIQLDIILVLYYAGILAMYIFSMPLAEAITLAGVERYASSIILLFGGAILLCMTVDIENSFTYKIGEVDSYKSYKSAKTKKLYQQGVAVTCILCVTFLLSEFNGLVYIQNTYADSFPARLSAITGDRWYTGGKIDKNRYLLYASDNEGQMTDYYVQYVTKYFLFAEHVDGVCVFYEDNLENLLSQYDYIIIAETDPYEHYLMKKHFGINGSVGIYSTKDLLSKKDNA